MLLNHLFLFTFSFILGLFFSLILRRVSLKLNLCKPPTKIPYTGGLSFSLSFLIVYLFYIFISQSEVSFQQLWIIIFAFILLGIECLDDFKEFSLKTKLTTQIIFIALYLVYGKVIQIYFFPPWLNYLLSFVWIMGITNSFNHLDIKDGLCGGISFIIACSFLAVSIIKGNFLLGGLFSCLNGALLSFIVFNLPPARIFMGNSGSHFLGFLFAALSMYGDYATLKNPISLVTPLLILAFPSIDTGYLIYSRLKKNVLPFKKSDDHIYIRILSAGYSQQMALTLIYLLTITWCLSGIFVVYGFSYIFLTLAIFSLVLNLFVFLKANANLDPGVSTKKKRPGE